MEIIDYWRLCEVFSVPQAAMLLIGEDPSGLEPINQNDDRPDFLPKYKAAFTAISNAVVAGDLTAEIKYITETRFDSGTPVGFELVNMADLSLTKVKVDDLQKWLTARGVTSGFFFPNEKGVPDYLDASHCNHSIKMAAAIAAWQAVNEEPELCLGKSVREAMKVWLRKNADHLGLIKKDGKINAQAVDDISKVSNWDYGGGAPATPG